MKPVIRFEKGLWYCMTPPEMRGINFGVGETPKTAWKNWFEQTRINAARIMTDAVIFPHSRLRRRSLLARDCMGIIEHDRYLNRMDGDANEKRR
ncbi:TPA: hypothetical protein SMI39_004987 [Serratia marcescens]|nr:hypothetical protein [Serratia marcescens]HEJ8033601.1 hypothetical protein [Serratia marcescens]